MSSEEGAMRFIKFAAGVLIAIGVSFSASAQETVSVTIKNKHFSPSILHAPANKPIRIKVHNADGVAAEFESRTLRVEKIVPPGGTVVINVKPLVPGKYGFFDDFHQDNQGVLVAK
jgi:heme/copper-type cytochrome/quinol oxidase subunit 2